MKDLSCSILCKGVQFSVFLSKRIPGPAALATPVASFIAREPIFQFSSLDSIRSHNCCSIIGPRAGISENVLGFATLSGASLLILLLRRCMLSIFCCFVEVSKQRYRLDWPLYGTHVEVGNRFLHNNKWGHVLENTKSTYSQVSVPGTDLQAGLQCLQCRGVIESAGSGMYSRPSSTYTVRSRLYSIPGILDGGSRTNGMDSVHTCRYCRWIHAELCLLFKP